MAAGFCRLDETVSTNLWLREHAGQQDMVVWADYQTGGRGCGTNTWESERGQNLLFSMLFHPCQVPAARQFSISMKVALAVSDTLERMGLEGISLKWPNDIYWRDRKLAGILIENTLRGGLIAQSIIGIGLNVNQQQFRSDAPNPVSIRQITGAEHDRQRLLENIVRTMETRLQSDEDPTTDYNHRLYRREGVHLYRDAKGCFEAEIAEVKPDGTLMLRDTNRQLRAYAFKEVSFVIMI